MVTEGALASLRNAPGKCKVEDPPCAGPVLLSPFFWATTFIMKYTGQVLGLDWIRLKQVFERHIALSPLFTPKSICFFSWNIKD